MAIKYEWQNGKYLEESVRDLIQNIPAFLWRDKEKQRGAWVKMAGVSAEVRTEVKLNTKQEIYRYEKSNNTYCHDLGVWL
jgi:hypothetical protein